MLTDAKCFPRETTSAQTADYRNCIGMPKKKKNGPGAAGSGPPAEQRSAHYSEPGPNRAAVRTEPTGSGMTGASSLNKDEVLKNMQEMFSDLDPVVIYIVLSEADFKVDNAMDALLELSGAAEGKMTSHPPVSGFQKAAAILDPQQTEPSTAVSQHLTEELDSVIDRELETYTTPRNDPPPSSGSHPFFLSPPPLQSDIHNETYSSKPGNCPPSNTIGAQTNSSPVDGLSLPAEHAIPVDFSHLTDESGSEVSQTSAFKPYQSTQAVQSSWNVQAPVFQNPWTTAPLSLPSREPDSWTLPPQGRLRLEGRVLVLLRGAPGSGKSTLASAMLEQNPGGVVLSTDEYFTKNGVYCYQAELLGEAHAWNHRRAKEAFERALNPIIIDNTNMQCWEMKPYVALALKHKYRVLFREPNTWWKSKPRELEKRTKHGVTREKIRRMLENQDRYVSVQNIMGSRPISTAVYGVYVPGSDGRQCTLARFPSPPDLVGGASEFSDAGAYLSSSLPDVSSTELQFSPGESNPEPRENNSESKSLKESPEDLQSEELDGAELDRELDRELDASFLLLESKEDLQPWAWESMAQRARTDRGRGSRPQQLEAEGCEEGPLSEISGQHPKQLDFLGDWPSESLRQRPQRSRSSGSRSAGELTETSAEHSGKFLEFQKVLDLLQETGQGSQQSSSPPVNRAQKVLSNCVRDRTSSSRDDESSQSRGSAEDLESDQDEFTEHRSADVSSSENEKSDGASLIAESIGDLKSPSNLSAWTQTDSKDFAVLWRVEHQVSDNSTRKATIRQGDPSRFVPKTSEETSSEAPEIPYRVHHEKGSQVEESRAREQHKSLEILRRHFKDVPPETLEDLLEKCHQDVEWTTNLLLDSGECLCRDEEEDQGRVERAQEEALTLQKFLEEQVKESETFTGDSQLLEPEDTAGDLEIVIPSLTNPMGSDSELQLPPLRQDLSLCDPPVFELPKGSAQDLKEDLKAEVGTTQEDVDALMHSILTCPEDRDSHKERPGSRSTGMAKIQNLELKLSTELALQLTELFGPVGISPGEFCPDDCWVLMDLKLAELLHQKWKESIQERQRQEALTYRLLMEGPEVWDESWPPGQRDAGNVARPAVSLRHIMMEEQVMQESLEKSRPTDWDKKDSATLLKEQQLFSLFPSIDRHFLRDIFRDHGYSLEQTQQFLHALLDSDAPVRNVIAPEVAPERGDSRRMASKERRTERPDASCVYQDTEDPQYEDFRTEAVVQKRRQHECFQKAAEAHRQGRRDVASFYSQQGHLHGHRMKEANHRAAVQIFQRVNATLLPQNVLDLHGLHVDEALHHLQRVLNEKHSECTQGLCRPQLSVITGRGNHSQGGVARIRPAVLDYLKNQNYRYTEIKPGLVAVMLQ